MEGQLYGSAMKLDPNKNDLGGFTMSLIPAATVMVMHPKDPAPEFLVVHRNPDLPVQGNVWVFPGGRLAATDTQNGANGNALRACAVRETREEAGLDLDPAKLIKVVRWETPEGIPKRFDARFFLVPLAHKPVVQVDGREIVGYRWLTAEGALRHHHQREIELSAPGFVLLSWILSLGAAEKILSHFRQSPPLHVKPRLIQLSDGRCNVYQEDAAYESGDLMRSGPRHRLWMRESGWRYEGNPLA